MKRLLMMCAMLGLLVSCHKGGGDKEYTQFQFEDKISLNFHGQLVNYTLPTPNQGYNIKVKNSAYWISELRLNGNNMSFYAVENNELDRGYRTDTIVIYKGKYNIGEICVHQARTYISPEPLAWALPNAMYSTEILSEDYYTGQQLTQMVYELEKTTNGKDSYKNYPAFAYCIEMNIDPENNMEWHLENIDAIEDYCREEYGNRQDFMRTPFAEHNIWWTATDYYDTAPVIVRSTTASSVSSKLDEHYVLSFRNGRIDE